MSDQFKAIVIDNSYNLKAGFSNENEPSIQFNSDILGKQAPSNNNNEILEDWEHRISLWRMIYNKLGVNSEEYPVIISEQPINPKMNRLKTIEYLFEEFNASAAYMSQSSLLTMYSMGIISGMVLECGHSSSYALPVYEAYALPNAIKKLSIAGKHLDKYLSDLLSPQHYGSIDIDSIRQLKETLSLSSSQEQNLNYKLPDGRELTLNSNALKCPESLFNPEILGCSEKGIHQLLYGSYLSCPDEYQSHINQNCNFVLSGGSTKFKGFSDRLSLEITKLFTSLSGKPNIIIPPNPSTSAWKGGASLVSNLGSFWIRKSEYLESGPSIVERKLSRLFYFNKMSNNIDSQSAILPEHCKFGIYLTSKVNLKNENDKTTLKNGLSKFIQEMNRIEKEYPDTGIGSVVSFGYDLLGKLTSSYPGGYEMPKGFKNMIPIGSAPSTQSDIFIHILGNRFDVAFHAAENFYFTFRDCGILEIQDEQHGFRRLEERDETGFIDGTENPTGLDKRVRFGLIAKGDPHEYGSYVFPQKWEHNLVKWEKISLHEQQDTIGRTKKESIEIPKGKRQVSSHVSRTDLKDNGVSLKIIRQSLPYGMLSKKEHGLYFLAYACSLVNIEKQLLSMFGQLDGKSDLLLQYTKPITGGYYFAPSLNELNKILNS
ncbi:actin [Tieghemostelium lacteum]|uniref:Actin n=1 Tax=Tieghemostelium lacteum TaxID=361077 RepID=A0A151ZBQ9_TIELA|nr:actin [Tieghemostelium lacteum]|eukprot:KYQ91387.1 actin [Tieghemostelium lacteum]